MNIFASFPDPVQSARVLDDVRLNKMILESTQMLCTAARIWGATHGLDGTELYRKTHHNHPANVWIRDSFANWKWLYAHAEAMNAERMHRFNKPYHHAAWAKVIRWKLLKVARGVAPRQVLEAAPTPFANCAANSALGIDFKHEKDTHVAYRKYLRARWLNDTRPPKCSVLYLYKDNE